MIMENNNYEKVRPLVSTDYKPLHTLLPLISPLRLGMGFTTRCNFRCEFCYLYSVDKSKIPPAKDMPFKLVEKIAKDICEFENPVSVADLSQNGEPLLYPNLEEAIKLLKDTKKIKSIRIITNGSLISPQKAEKLIDAGLNQVMVSINGLNDQQYKKIVHSDIKFDTIYENIKYLYSIRQDCHIHIKMIANYFSEDEQKKFFEIFTPISDSIYMDKAVNQWIGLNLPTPTYGRESSIDRFGKHFCVDENTLPVCSAPFYFLRIHPSGKTSVCLGDWEAAMSLGDVNDTSLKEIWNGKELADLRKAQLTRRNIPSQCDKCHYYELTTSEDITPYSEELIKRYGFDN
jgi:radical SAM protein with 4Fe4S-binding SPASM domain